jgi:hypothetical protein
MSPKAQRHAHLTLHVRQTRAAMEACKFLVEAYEILGGGDQYQLSNRELSRYAKKINTAITLAHWAFVTE